MALEVTVLFKLIIMHMINKVDFPLTNSQISQFFLDNEYTNYFTVQKCLNELIEDDFVFSHENRNTTYYHLSAEGRESLKFFESKIPNAIADEVDTFLLENKYELRNEVGTISDYYQSSNGEYTVHCQIKEGTGTIIEINIAAPDKDTASYMCSRFDEGENSQEIYQFILEKLNS